MGGISQKVWSPPPRRPPGVRPAVVLALHRSFARHPWEGDARGGEQPPSSLGTGGRLMHPREAQPGGYGCPRHPHPAVGRGCCGSRVPQLSKPSSLSFVQLVPACPVPPAPRVAGAPHVCQGQSKSRNV